MSEAAPPATPPPPKKKVPELPPPPPPRYRYDLGPDMLETLYKAFHLVSKKGAKKKPNEVEEKDVPVLMRALGFNPSDKHIEYVILRAREDEDPKHATKGFLDMDNVQNKIAELFHEDPTFAYRHSEKELVAAMQALCPPGQDFIEPDDLYDAMTKHGICFTHDEVELMIRSCKDRDTHKVWHEDYAFLAANDSIPKPPNIVATELPPDIAPPEAADHK